LAELLLLVLLLRPALLFELELDALFFEPVDLVGIALSLPKGANRSRPPLFQHVRQTLVCSPLVLHEQIGYERISTGGLGRPRRPIH
jgi:hypothetical protein